jgi:hypothetical protein
MENGNRRHEENKGLREFHYLSFLVFFCLCFNVHLSKNSSLAVSTAMQ